MRDTSRRIIVPLVAGVMAFGTASSAEAQSLSPSERSVVRAVDARIPPSLDLLQRIVNINSGTHNPSGVRAVADVLAVEFEALGFEVRWIDGAAWGRAGHLVAERRAPGGGPRLLLIGHLDTVFEPDSPFQRFTPVAGDSARGPGITDMKGGDVVMLLALQALSDAGLLDRLQVTAVFTGDEEDSGEPLTLARRDLVDAADWADIALGFENGPEDPHVTVVARRSSTGWRLHTTGVPSHSSQIFQPAVGSGAIYQAARVLAAFHDSLAGEPYLTFNPGVIVGGTTVTFDSIESRGAAFGKANVVAQTATVTGDLRTLTPEQLARARATMQRLAGRHYPQTTSELTFSDSYPPFAPADGNLRLAAMLDRASRDAGLPPVATADPSRAGAADISFTAGRVEMAIDGMGLKGRADHTVNETADLRMLAVQAKRAALLMARLASQPTVP